MKTIVYFLYLIKFICIRSELINVVEINRHGARTPANFPKETSKLFFGSKTMQLTINGFRQEQLLGEFVKSKYIKNTHFLKKRFDSKEFKMVSSPTERTIFSAAGFVTGLYPDFVVKMKYEDDPEMKVEDSIPIADNILTIKEIPIQVVNQKKDSLFHAHKCLYKGKRLEDYFDSLNFTQIFTINTEEKAEAVANLTEFLGIQNKTIGESVNDEFKEIMKYFSPIYYHFGNSKSNDLDKESFTTLKKYILNRWYSHRIYDSKYLRLTASAFLQTILNNFEISRHAYENKVNYTKYFAYSGHDTIMVNILSNLLSSDYLKSQVLKAINDTSIYKFLIPPYASNMFFELHTSEKTGKYFVYIIYNGKFISEGLKDIKSESAHKNRIDYDKFINLVSELIDEDYRQLDCSKTKKDFQTDNENIVKKRQKLKKLK